MVSAVVACGFSVLATVAIVLVNKRLISTLGYKVVTTLTSFHMCTTAGFLDLVAFRLFSWFEPKPLPWPPLLQFALLNGLAVAALNLALGHASPLLLLP